MEALFCFSTSNVSQNRGRSAVFALYQVKLGVVAGCQPPVGHSAKCEAPGWECIPKLTSPFAYQHAVLGIKGVVMGAGSLACGVNFVPPVTLCVARSRPYSVGPLSKVRAYPAPENVTTCVHQATTQVTVKMEGVLPASSPTFPPRLPPGCAPFGAF